MNEATKPEGKEATVLQVRRIGNSLGLILPKELLAQLRLEEGDRLTVVEQPERGLKLTPYEDVHSRGMEIARQLMREYSATLRELAK